MDSAFNVRLVLQFFKQLKVILFVNKNVNLLAKPAQETYALVVNMDILLATVGALLIWVVIQIANFVLKELKKLLMDHVLVVRIIAHHVQVELAISVFKDFISMSVPV